MFGRRRKNSASSGVTGVKFSRLEVMPYRSNVPSSTTTLHFPHVAFSAQIDSISTPNSRAIDRKLFQSAASPRRPEGCKITVGLDANEISADQNQGFPSHFADSSFNR